MDFLFYSDDKLFKYFWEKYKNVKFIYIYIEMIDINFNRSKRII